jgi:cell wall-associated NlpC family hydrolase
VTGADIVAAARGWMGVRWKHHGRSREGVDCCGLIIMVAKELGYFDFDVTDYGRVATDESMREYARLHFDEISANDLKPGDVLILRFDPNRHMAFVGGYPGGGLSLIHAYSRAPHKVVEARLDDNWRRLILGAFRFRGLE